MKRSRYALLALVGLVLAACGNAGEDVSDGTFWSVVLWMIWLFFIMMFFWMFVTVLADLWTDKEASGGSKAGWTILIVLLPLLGILIYLIARGDGMNQRAMAKAAAAQEAQESYIREVAGSPADELAKLADLKDKGLLSEEEFDSAKAKLLS